MPAISSLVIIGAGLAVAGYTARRDKRRRTAMLYAVAERRRGTLDVGGFFGNPLVELRSHDGVEITISMWSTRHGKYTEYSARLPLPGLPAFRLTPSGAIDTLGRAFGAQAITVGVPRFDNAFALKGDDVPIIERIWSSAHARELASAYPGSRVDCEGTQLRLLQPIIESVEQVEDGIDLLLELARCDPYANRVLADLPEATLERNRYGSGFHEAVLPGPTRIRVAPRRRKGRVRTCAWTAAVGTLAADAETHVTALGATLEQSEQELAIWWPSVEADARRLVAAVDLLRRLASGPSLGVFR